MDYVVFGIGFGATILVIGLLIRDLGPRLRYRAPADGSEVLHAEALVAKVAWTRFSIALGSVLALAGALFLIVTFVCMALMLSDSTGGWVMLGTLAMLLVLVAFWTWAFFDRFGSYGILPERPVAEPEREPEPVRPVAREATVIGPPLPDEMLAAESSPAEVDDGSEAGGDEVAPTPEERVEDEADEAGERLAAADTEPLVITDDAGEPDGAAPDAADATVPAPPAEDRARNGQETAPVDVAAPGNATATPDAEPERARTPEEVLAAVDDPIEHGSAEGDLDIANPARPRPHRVPSGESPERPGARPDEDDTSEE